MARMSHDEPLQLLSTANFANLQKEFLADWPRSITGYTLLEMQKQWKELGIDYGFKVYCPFGIVNNGMVAFNKKGECHEYIIMCPKDDTSTLEEALSTTKLIDWRHFITVPCTPEHVVECLKKVSRLTQLFSVQRGVGDSGFVMDLNRPLFDISWPPDISLGPVLTEHTKYVQSRWDRDIPDTDWYFKLLVENKCGYGLFKNNELIAWVFINEAGFLFHFYTVEGERRKGYGELLMKIVCNELLKNKRYVTAYCVKGNENVARLYTKLGFKRFGPVSWHFLKPNHPKPKT